MDELQVIVQQEVGKIKWNYEEIKPALAQMMKDYEGVVYTADSVKTAKNDIAFLRKLKKAISDKRIEIKNKCLEPYEIFEKQAAELTELIEKPIKTIDEQLTEYEKIRREEVREKISQYFDEVGADLPEAILNQVKSLKYKAEWENVSTATKRWKQGVEDAVRLAQRELAWIDESVEEEFKEAAVSAYQKHLVLADVMTEVTKLRKAKEAILLKERERIAAEEKAKAEAEAKKKLEEELKARSETVPQDSGMQNTPSDIRLHTKSATNDSGLNILTPQQQNANMGSSRTSEGEKAEIHTLRIKATPDQMKKICGYINYCGAVYREA